MSLHALLNQQIRDAIATTGKPPMRLVLRSHDFAEWRALVAVGVPVGFITYHGIPIVEEL